MLWLLYCTPLLFKVLQGNDLYGSGGYIVYHYCLRFDRGGVHNVVVILPAITVLGLTEGWFMLWLLYCISLLFRVLQRNDLFGNGGYIVYHCCLRFDRGVVHLVVGYIVHHYCLKF